MENRTLRFFLFCFLVIGISMISTYAQRLEVPITLDRGVKRQPGTDRGRDRSDRPSSNENTENSNSTNTVLSDIVQFSPGSPGTLIGSPGAFTQKVLAYNGRLPVSIRRLFGNRSSIGFLIQKPNKATGHHYVTLNSIGKLNFTTDQVMALIAQNPSRVFPFLDALGTNGQKLSVGNTYYLTGTIFGFEVVKNPVKVTSVNRYTFTFTTQPGHKLQGSATHGLFIDATGEMWLFQEGVGVAGEDESLQEFTYGAANVMWGKMSENIKREISTVPQAPVRGTPCSTQNGTSFKC